MTATPIVAPRRTAWISVAMTAVIILVAGTIAIILGGVVFFYDHITSADVAPAAAANEFRQTRDRFAGRQPLVEITAGRVIRRPTPDTPRRPISTFHVIAYHPDDGELTRLDLPGWTLRFVPSMSGSGVFEKLDLTHGTGLSLTLDDLERFGPGLILDMHRPDVEALMWTE